MPKFSDFSKANLATCHPDLQCIFNRVIEHVDCRVLQGHRGQEEQDRLFQEGKSKLMFPASKHNNRPALAVDVVPYPIDWKNWRRFDFLSGVVWGIAGEMGIQIRWGGDWDRDLEFNDQTFHDLPHFELYGESFRD